MDHDDRDAFEEQDLVRLLVLEAGRLMEDTSPDFALKLPQDPSERAETLKAMLQSLQTIRKLLEAAVTFNTFCSAAGPPHAG